MFVPRESILLGYACFITYIEDGFIIDDVLLFSTLANPELATRFKIQPQTSKPAEPPPPGFNSLDWSDWTVPCQQVEGMAKSENFTEHRAYHVD